MGLVKQILSLKKVRPISTLYSDYLSSELSENFHLHLRNTRVELDHKEFEVFCSHILRAYRKWKKLDKPEVLDKNNTGEIVYLDKATISPVAGLYNPAVSNNELRIELQQWADYIHLHWKWLRLELTIEEFLEFHEAVIEAGKKLEEVMSEYPKRTGKFHRASPCGRVDKRLPGYFTEAKEDYQLENPHRTHLLNKADKELRRDKEYFDVSQNRIYLNIHDLYDISVYHAQELRPWAVNEKGIDVSIVARYEFVDTYMKNGQELSDEEIEQTNYYFYLSRRVDETPRDGGAIWIYTDPMKQAKRFMALINSIHSHGYDTKEHSDIIKSFESIEKIRHSETKYFGSPTIVEMDYSERPFAGMMTVRKVKGAFSVWNGLGRLTILKYFCDKGIINNDIFPVIPLVEGKPPFKLPVLLKLSSYPRLKRVGARWYSKMRRGISEKRKVA